MARKPKTSETHAEPETEESRRERLIEAAMALAARDGWHGLRMTDIAEHCQLPLSDALVLVANKQHILAGFTRRVNRTVLAGTPPPDPSETPRDRLFDLLMRRFDALQSYRAALHRIARDLGRDPLAAACHLRRLADAMTLMLECAGIDTSGTAGRFRVKGLALVYAAALKAWFDDDSPDLAHTMAVLDRGLMRAERLAGLLWPAGGTTNGG